MKSILGLDLGTHMGWGLSIQGIVTSGSEHFQSATHELWGMRFWRFGRWLKTTFETEKPDVIAYERVRHHTSCDASHVYGGFRAFLHAFADYNKIPLYPLEVKQIKKYATGTGAATKDFMIRAAQLKWPEEMIIDDHQADALWIMDFASSKINK